MQYIKPDCIAKIYFYAVTPQESLQLPTIFGEVCIFIREEA